MLEVFIVGLPPFDPIKKLKKFQKSAKIANSQERRHERAYVKA
jgi:hypothetical protein